MGHCQCGVSRLERVAKQCEEPLEKDVRQGKVTWEGGFGDLKVAAAWVLFRGFCW